MDYQIISGSKPIRNDVSFSSDYINIVLNQDEIKKIYIDRETGQIRKSNWIWLLGSESYSHEVYRKCKKE